MNSEYAGTIRERKARPRGGMPRSTPHALAIQLLGPLTILAGIVWAIAQPYRIVLLEREDKSLYELVVQPPLLVIAVGLVYALLIAPGLVEDLEDDGAPSR